MKRPGWSFFPEEVIAVILGGGAGTRLFPLTRDRAKPAVPLASKYRLVDIPISLCIHAGLRRIFVLTQFNSSSLHRHIQQTYRFDDYSRGFVQIMAAQQTPRGASWYQGTADAVRQNLIHFDNHPHQWVLILAGDQLYRMDFRVLLEEHVTKGADVTVAVNPVGPERANSLGIMEINEELRITRFVEKPKDPKELLQLELSPYLRSVLQLPGEEPCYLASMGIYVFNRKVLGQALQGIESDFGSHIIPSLIRTHRVFAFLHRGYWEDIGTIGAFYKAHMELCQSQPPFDFFDATYPIYTHCRHLPSSTITCARMEHTLVAEGCRIGDASLERSVIGIRSVIGSGARITSSILMGNDFFESDAEALAAEGRGIPRLGIGRNSRIERAIIDKNARIGDNVVISPEGKHPHMDGDGFYVRDGIVVIPRNAVIHHNRVI
ncbi:glucose-1-phosphate adenylyltransferase [Candidatus Methylacidithermus pantelleriae]|uniref:Glucose-1-phosphate adenylyltransferase n=1 Tax=Candidatus Methylacidithermus pantelleriae TaxID=2744239 RepID=A0A8J2BS59_9BACT|nr:glucose-1-phosphate adenylyltransferase [Candidatus Methylacidithermus pantelleriae]CAF0695933.1 Glucose-1-phosphate adenylyltransferase [Candidatus Methylacidithermus pantelleriae]